MNELKQLTERIYAIDTPIDSFDYNIRGVKFLYIDKSKTELIYQEAVLPQGEWMVVGSVYDCVSDFDPSKIFYGFFPSAKLTFYLRKNNFHLGKKVILYKVI